uniref:Uncharacterized protein n=1 Tax=Rhizophora mucronata TaxID=61149 RepID=A0A2P2NS93_RHIMU
MKEFIEYIILYIKCKCIHTNEIESIAPTIADADHTAIKAPAPYKRMENISSESNCEFQISE